jgi:chemotaxis protein methyltransferase CheR
MSRASAALRQVRDDAAAPADSLTDADFDRLSRLMTGHTGIRLPSAKRTMLEGRLRKRMRATGRGSLADYCRFVFDEGGLEAEMIHMIDAVTTNKTDFFREQDHFDFLRRHVVPESIAHHSGRSKPLIKVWSAAASNGAEAYTTAMVLADAAGASNPRFEFSILGTDISTEILAQARRAVYGEDFVRPVPAEMQRRFMMRSRNKAAAEIRIVPELRRRVRFMRLNLLDDRYPVDRDVDVIFLRNVLIYFDKPTQKSVVEKLLRHLRPGGYLMLGHSETMIGGTAPVRQLAPAVFQTK